MSDYLLAPQASLTWMSAGAGLAVLLTLAALGCLVARWNASRRKERALQRQRALYLRLHREEWLAEARAAGRLVADVEPALEVTDQWERGRHRYEIAERPSTVAGPATSSSPGSTRGVETGVPQDASPVAELRDTGRIPVVAEITPKLAQVPTV